MRYPQASAMASPPISGLPDLNLEQERAFLEAAIGSQPGLKEVYAMDASLQNILDAAPTASK